MVATLPGDLAARMDGYLPLADPRNPAQTLKQEICGNRWALVAAELPGKTGQQCAQRWRHKVNPSIKKEKWTPEEDAQVRPMKPRLTAPGRTTGRRTSRGLPFPKRVFFTTTTRTRPSRTVHRLDHASALTARRPRHTITAANVNQQRNT